MYKLYRIISCCLWVLFFIHGSQAFSVDFNWTNGEVVLADSSRLTGELSVNYPLDLLIIKKDQGIQVYPAHTVKSFTLYDDQTGKHRRFITHTYQSVRGLKGQVFFEIVAFGPLTLLRREKKYHRLGPYKSLPAANSDHAFKETKTNKYVYFVLNGSVVTDFKTFQKELSTEVFAAYGLEINSFMRKERLKPWKHDDFARMISYYNALRFKDQSDKPDLAYIQPKF